MISVFEQSDICITYCDSKKYSDSLLKENDNIILFSGGIDSQSVILYFKKHNIKFKTLFCDYSHNVYDKSFAEKIGYDIELPLDLDKFFFVDKSHLTYYDLYQCTSPQLSVHFYMIEYIRNLYPLSNIIMPGMPPFYNYNDNKTIANSLPDYVQLSYYRYKKKNKLTNFYPYFWLEFHDVKKMMNSNVQLNFDIIDYTKKIMLYNELGLDVIPQEIKKTGFEEYKSYLKNEKNLIFDHELRKPINKNKKTIGVFDPSILSKELSDFVSKKNV